ASRPVIPESVSFPIREALPAFTRGELYQQGGAWNLGLLAGLHGLRTLVPLLAAWGIAGLAWWRLARGKQSAIADYAAQDGSVAPLE
ncbi:MAG: hypothetical protein ACM34G_03445, partial [Acidobacteriota bacterium]